MRIDNASGYIEKINQGKYLVFDDTDENKELLKKYNDVFNEIMGKIKKIGDYWLEYTKNYTKIKFNSDDNLHNLHNLNQENVCFVIIGIY